MKEQVLNITSKAKKLANMLHQAHINCSKQATLKKHFYLAGNGLVLTFLVFHSI